MINMGDRVKGKFEKFMGEARLMWKNDATSNNGGAIKTIITEFREADDGRIKVKVGYMFMDTGNVRWSPQSASFSKEFIEENFVPVPTHD